MKTFGEDVLGKGVVEAKDTPNFIANRIGTYGLLVTVREMLENKYTIGEVDSVTGPLIGRPKSATFRTLDVVGLDTFSHVARNVYEQVEGKEKDIFSCLSLWKECSKKGGSVAKQGKGSIKNGKTILELDPVTLTYGERTKLKDPGIDIAKQQRGQKRN